MLKLENHIIFVNATLKFLVLYTAYLTLQHGYGYIQFYVFLQSSMNSRAEFLLSIAISFFFFFPNLRKFEGSFFFLINSVPFISYKTKKKG